LTPRWCALRVRKPSLDDVASHIVAKKGQSCDAARASVPKESL
jgi:hypothetical protein